LTESLPAGRQATVSANRAHNHTSLIATRYNRVMELPAELKTLYRHWELHTKRPASRPPTDLFEDKKLFDNISWFIGERLDIWKKKTAHKTPLYTEDPILAHFRFCNIFREFDWQTIEFHRLLNPLHSDFPLWLLNMFYCRMVARTETIKNVGLLSFDKKENADLYERLMNSPRPRYGTPYVFPVSTIQRSPTPTRELFITRHLPDSIPAIAAEIQTWQKESVYDSVKKILPIFGFNLSFLWTEVLIDVAYQFPEHLDLFARFPIGPGAAPTLEKINSDKDPSLFVQELCAIDIDTTLTFENKPLFLSAENWEGIACEFRKYTNLKKGKGRRRIYTPKPR